MKFAELVKAIESLDTEYSVQDGLIGIEEEFNLTVQLVQESPAGQRRSYSITESVYLVEEISTYLVFYEYNNDDHYWWQFLGRAIPKEVTITKFELRNDG